MTHSIVVKSLGLVLTLKKEINLEFEVSQIIEIIGWRIFSLTKVKSALTRCFQLPNH